MPLVRKYWLRILLLLLWGIFIFYFAPHQKDFYLSSDMERFTSDSRRFLIIFEVALFCLFLLWSIVKFKKNRQVLGRAIMSVILLVVFYLIFKDGFTAVGLYANRLVPGEIVTRRYVPQYLYGAEKSEDSFSLCEVGSKNTLINGDLVRSAYRLGVDNGDTVRVDLKKGLLGVLYFDSLSVSKE